MEIGVPLLTLRPEPRKPDHHCPVYMMDVSLWNLHIGCVDMSTVWEATASGLKFRVGEICDISAWLTTWL